MAAYTCLDDYLNAAAGRAAHLHAVGETVQALAEAGWRIRAILAQGPLAGQFSAVVGSSLDGEGQKKLDVITHDIVRNALARRPAPSRTGRICPPARTHCFMRACTAR